jgi:uncharacterized membrane protein
MIINDPAAWLLTALPAVGAGLSLWIARRSTGGRGLPGCGAGSGCDAVTRSRWSKWLGIPVAAPAAAVYFVVLASFAVLGVFSSGRGRQPATGVLLAAAPLLAAAAVWFIGLQGLLLRRFCLYCLLLHGIGVAVAVMIAFGLPGEGSGFAYSGLPTAELIGVLSAAGVGIAALVLGQVLVKPKTYMVGAVVGGQWPVVSGEEGDKPTAQRSGASDECRGVESSPINAPSATIAGEDAAPGQNIRGSAALRPRLDGRGAVAPILSWAGASP